MARISWNKSKNRLDIYLSYSDKENERKLRLTGYGKWKDYNKMNYKLKKISGDASFREFYRIKKNNKTSIIVFAKKEQFKNLIVYSVVNRILNNNNIQSPKLLNDYYKE